MNTLQKHLDNLLCCEEAIEWAARFKGKGALKKAWHACKKGNWLQFYAWCVDLPAWEKMSAELSGMPSTWTEKQVRSYFPELPK